MSTGSEAPHYSKGSQSREIGAKRDEKRRAIDALSALISSATRGEPFVRGSRTKRQQLNGVVLELAENPSGYRGHSRESISIIFPDNRLLFRMSFLPGPKVIRGIFSTTDSQDSRGLGTMELSTPRIKDLVQFFQ